MTLPSAQWLAEALFASSLLMLAVLALRLPAQKLFGARVAYLLWLLPALRMVLPSAPWTDAGPAPLHLRLDLPAAVHPVPPDVPHVVELGLLIDPHPVPLVAHWPLDLVTALVTLWAAGAALHLAWHLLAHRRFLVRIGRGTALLSDAGIAVLSGPAVPGPLATGLVRRMVLLPADFAVRYAPRERRLVLAHEVAHHVRGDLWANLAGLVVLSLHWFNPLAHRAYRVFRADQELACDETVLAHEPADAAQHYGRAVVKSATARYPAAACAMHTAGLVKQRLRMMARARPGVTRGLFGAACGLALVAGGLGLTASGAAADLPAHPAVTFAPIDPAAWPERAHGPVTGAVYMAAAHPLPAHARALRPAAHAAPEPLGLPEPAEPTSFGSAEAALAAEAAAEADEAAPAPDASDIDRIVEDAMAASRAAHVDGDAIREQVRRSLEHAGRLRASALADASHARAFALADMRRSLAESAREREAAMKELRRALREMERTHRDLERTR